MLMIDIPECDVLEHATHIRHLEEDGGVETIADCTTNHAHKMVRIRDMLKRHLACDEVGLDVRVLLRVKVLDELNRVPALFRSPLRHERRIKSDAAISAHRTKHRDKFTLAATDLDHRLVTQSIALDQVRR